MGPGEPTNRQPTAPHFQNRQSNRRPTDYRKDGIRSTVHRRASCNGCTEWRRDGDTVLALQGWLELSAAHTPMLWRCHPTWVPQRYATFLHGYARATTLWSLSLDVHRRKHRLVGVLVIVMGLPDGRSELVTARGAARNKEFSLERFLISGLGEVQSSRHWANLALLGSSANFALPR